MNNIKIKPISKAELKKADDFQQQILNPKHKRRYRTFGCVKNNNERKPSLLLLNPFSYFFKELICF